MSEQLPIQRFSTDAFAPHERHEAWSQRHWPSFVSASVSTPDGDFSAFCEEISLGLATVFYGMHSAQTVHRAPRLIRADGIDHLGLCVALEGELHGESYLVPRGGILLADLSVELMHHATASRTITIALPRTLVEDAGIAVRANHLRVIDAARSALLRSHLIQLRQSAPQLLRTDAPILLQTIVSLLAATLHGANLGGRPVVALSGGLTSAAKVQAIDLIERYIGEAALDVGLICRRLNLSRSALYRMFEDSGGVQAHIRNRRLDLARAALLEPGNERSIREIAAQYSFYDPAHFSRVFRKRFAISPRDLRSAERTLDN